MEEFACVDYDKVCDKNVPKADAVCFHLRDCGSVTVYIVEKKEKLDPTSDKSDRPLSQLDSTKSYLSQLCQNVECNLLLVVYQLTYASVKEGRRQLPYVVEYKKIKNKNKQELNIREKIAKFVYENKE